MSKDKTHRDPADQLANTGGGFDGEIPRAEAKPHVSPPNDPHPDDAEHVLKTPHPHADPPNPPNPPGRGTGSDKQRISRCRVVEFTDMRGHTWPAIVLAVKDDGTTVDLMLLTNRGATPDFDIPQSKVPAGEEKSRGRWSWPPRS